MSKRKSVMVYRTDLVNIGIGQGQKEMVPYLSGQTEYDTEGRVILQCNYSQGGLLTEKIILEYDPAGKIVREINYTGDGELSEEKNFEYDSGGKLTRELKKYSDGATDITTFTYDGTDLLAEKVTVDDDGEVEVREIFAYLNARMTGHETLDGEGNLLASETFEYDEHGHITMHSRDNTETGEYFKLRIKYNEAGRKIAEMLYNDEDELVETTWFEEDEKGRVIQTVEEGIRYRKIRQFSFDAMGNSLGYEETDNEGNKLVVVEHRYESGDSPVSSLVFVNGGGRRLSEHYELKYEYKLWD